MKLLRALAVLVVMSGVSAFAAIPTSPFTECPAVGIDATGCQLLIVVSTVNGAGTATAFNVYTSTTDNAPFDDCDDVLVGVLNSSGAALKSISLTAGAGSQAFAFDGDGACAGTYSPSPTLVQCGTLSTTDPADYGSATAVWTAFCIEGGACSGGSNGDSGTLQLGGGGGLANNASSFFSLEGEPSAASILPGAPPAATPIPSSSLLFLTGLLALATFYLASGKFSRAN
jgi:hypothetical protein